MSGGVKEHPVGYWPRRYGRATYGFSRTAPHSQKYLPAIDGPSEWISRLLRSLTANDMSLL